VLVLALPRGGVPVAYDETRAVEPLERWGADERREAPATYPFAGEPLPR
jgi:hypothetical protein